MPPAAASGARPGVEGRGGARGRGVRVRARPSPRDGTRDGRNAGPQAERARELQTLWRPGSRDLLYIELEAGAGSGPGLCGAGWEAGLGLCVTAGGRARAAARTWGLRGAADP